MANPIIGEIAGIDSLPLTQAAQPGLRGRAGRRSGSRSARGRPRSSPRESGQRVAANLLQAAPKLDAIWNHDDDQGIGVLAAIKQAGRNEFFMVGGAGSANAMRDIKADNTRAEGDRHLPPDDGLLGDLAGPADRPGQGHVRPGGAARCPTSITLASATITKENVDNVPAARASSHGGSHLSSGQRDAAGRHGRLRLHGRGALAGVAHRGPRSSTCRCGRDMAVLCGRDAAAAEAAAARLGWAVGRDRLAASC